MGSIFASFLFFYFLNVFCHIQLLFLICIQHFPCDPIRVDPGPILWIHWLIYLYLSHLSFWGISLPIKSDKSETKLHIKLHHKLLLTQPSTMSFSWSTSRVQLTSKHSKSHAYTQLKPSFSSTHTSVHPWTQWPCANSIQRTVIKGQFSERVYGHFGKLSVWKLSQGPCKTEWKHLSLSARFDFLSVPICIKFRFMTDFNKTEYNNTWTASFGTDVKGRGLEKMSWEKQIFNNLHSIGWKHLK